MRTHDSSRTADQQDPKMLAPTLADPHQDCPVAAGMLARDKPQPGSHVATVVEVATISDGSNDGCGSLRPHAPYLPDPPTGLALSVNLAYTSVELSDPPVVLSHQFQKG